MFKESDSVTNFLRQRTSSAYDEVVNEHIGMLRKFVYRIVLNEHDTDDIVQEVFIAAYKKIDSFRGKSKFSTWLCRIASNAAFSLIRKRGKITTEYNDESMGKTPCAEYLNNGLISAEACAEIETALSALPDKVRAALTLVTIENMPIGEAAAALGCTTPTLYWRVHKGRKILAQKLSHLLGGKYENE